MSYAEWSLFVGVLLVAMVLTGSLLSRLPLSSAMVYLAVGYVLGHSGWNVLRLDIMASAPVLERLAEIGLLISLFAVGLQLGVPLRDRRWRLPLRLAFISMAALVAMIAVVGMWLLDLSLGAAILLGAILAPTDPVLASAVQSEPGSQPDRVRFSLAAEGGLNDGAAFPFVILGLGLLGLHETGPALSRWWTVDLLWATVGGAAIGSALGAMTGRLVVYLRSRHGEAAGLNEFLGVGLVAMAYGAAQMSLASGFLAVFAAGLALQRVRERVGGATPAGDPPAPADGVPRPQLSDAVLPDSAAMRDSVQHFNEQLERLAELTLVLIVGALLASTVPLPATWWFVPVVLVLLRPASVLAATAGEQLSGVQHGMIAWFGIRGIGSVFYLLFALRSGVEGALAELLVSLTLWTVAASIVVHGLTAQPLTRRYLSRARVR